ncbi:MAG: hypothetical protein ABIF85_04095 [Nanoarchaeota archaeon]|nr:hypothetical protein [Nanoarchaeota archaeon]MBU4301042.1 hypothetical protein [Nanoarchaeota archaeon]MBU4452288.1 hypothetical protein [Nanoarchaeota archaeon]MCG2724034.1 hypothetical protein [archaeon]
MSTEQPIREFVTIPKETFDCMLHDFEHLLGDFEQIAEVEAIEIAKRRFQEIKTGMVKPITEKEFRELMKREGIE